MKGTAGGDTPSPRDDLDRDELAEDAASRGSLRVMPSEEESDEEEPFVPPGRPLGYSAAAMVYAAHAATEVAPPSATLEQAGDQNEMGDTGSTGHHQLLP